MKYRLFCILFLGTMVPSTAQKTEISFKVVFKGKTIGTLHAVEERSGTKSNKDLRTDTDVSIFAMSIHVESEVTSTHDNDIFVEGTSYRHANRGPEDIHAHVAAIGDKLYKTTRNGKDDQIKWSDHFLMCDRSIF